MPSHASAAHGELDGLDIGKPPKVLYRPEENTAAVVEMPSSASSPADVVSISYRKLREILLNAQRAEARGTKEELGHTSTSTLAETSSFVQLHTIGREKNIVECWRARAKKGPNGVLRDEPGR